MAAVVLVPGSAGPTAPAGPRDLPAVELASTTDPAPPTAVTVTPGSTTLAVAWTAPNEQSISGYRVYLDGVLTTTVTGRTASLTGLVNGRDYVVTVVTRTTTGIIFTTDHYGTVASAPVTSYPRDGVAPARPTGVAAVRGDGQVVLTWAANAEADLAGYRVLRDGVVVSGQLTGRTFTDTGLVNDRAYTYVVQAVDVSRQWSASSTPAVSATPTDLTAPVAPTGVAAVRGDARVTVTWAANAEADLAGYRVLRDGVVVSGLLTARTYADTGLVNDRAYAYSMVAVDTHGNVSPSSATVSATPTDLTAPATPTGFTAVRGDGQVVVGWAANAEADLAGYRVLRDGVVVSGLLTTRALTDTGLINDRPYAYAVVAVDTHGNVSPSSATVSATPTDLTAPATPTGFTAVRGDGQVVLGWAANAEPDLAGYRLTRDGVAVGGLLTARTLTDTALVNDRAYAYALVAVDTHGNVSPAASAGATPTDLTAPAAPTGVAAARGDGFVTVTWAANGEPDLAGYRVLRDGVDVSGLLTGRSVVDVPLVNDRTYVYVVVAVDTHGNVSTPSAAVTATPTDLTPPAAPTGVTAGRGDGQVALTWTASAEADLAGYRVLRDGVVVSGLLTGTAFTDAGLTNDRSYAYEVVAVDTHGNVSTSSAVVTAVPTDLTAPSAPTALAAAPGDTRADLTWAASPEADVVGYRVLRDGVVVATVTGPAYADTGLVNARAHAYAVVAVDGHGNVSAPSATVTATPVDTTAPGAPTAVAATGGDRSATVSWAAPADTDVVAYEVLMDGVLAATVPGSPVTLTGLVNGTTSAVSVRAVDSSGNRGPASAPVSVRAADAVAPAAPTALSGTAGDGSAALTWTAPADADVAGYRVLRDGVLVATVAGTSFADTGLVNGRAYAYAVVAVDTSGNLSAAASVTVTPAAPPATPVPALGSTTTGGVAASRDGRFVVTGTRARLEASDTNTAYELHLVDRTTGTARRIAPLPATATGATDPTNTAAPAVSDDGRYVALATTAALVPADTNRLADVYRLDTVTGVWALVSVPASGAVSASVAGTVLQTGASVYATSPSVAMSADGGTVLFYSARADLAAGDTNGVVDVFAKTTATGAVTRVSTTAAGASLGRTATGPALALTPDGRYALFTATGSSGPLVLYRKTLTGPTAGEAVVVSTVVAAGKTTEVAVFRDAGDVAISDDGRYVAFSTAAKPAAPTTNGSTGLAYRKDVVTGALAPLGSGQTTAWEHQVALDPTGRYAFFSTAAGAVTADTNGHTDHYRRDLTSGALLLVTADATGRAPANVTGAVAAGEYGRLLPVGADGVLVVTVQALLPSDTNGLRDLYRKDLLTGRVDSALSG